MPFQDSLSQPLGLERATGYFQEPLKQYVSSILVPSLKIEWATQGKSGRGRLLRVMVSIDH